MVLRADDQGRGQQVLTAELSTVIVVENEPQKVLL